MAGGQDKEAGMAGEIQALADRFESRFAGLEKWLERLTNTVEKFSESNGRLAVAETKIAIMETQLAAVTAKAGMTRETVIKQGAYGAGFIAAGAALMKLFGAKLGFGG